MIDNEVDFGNILDAPARPAATLNLKPRVKSWKATWLSKSSAPNLAAETKDGNTGAVAQGNSSEELVNSRSLTCPGSETVDIGGSHGIIDTQSKDMLTVPSGTLNSCYVVSGSAASGASAVGSVSQNDEHVDDSSKLGTHHKISVVLDNHASTTSSCGKTIDDTIDFGEPFDAQAKEETVSKLQPKVKVKLPKLAATSRKTNQKVSALTIDAVIENEKSDTNQIRFKDDNVQARTCLQSGGQTSDSEVLVGAESKVKGKSVSFDLPVASEGVASRDTNSVMGDFSSFCNDLYNLRQKTADKYPEGGPSDLADEQQPKSHVGEIGSSMKLRSRKILQKVGISLHTIEGTYDDELSTSDQDNDSIVDYTAGSKRNIRRKSRDGVKEPQQHGVQNDESRVSLRRKKILKDAPTKNTEKKLAHKIRQKRTKEVTTLLETPYEEIDHKKLSATHLRLLQEARARINVKETSPRRSSITSSQHENLDDFGYDRYDETENFDEDRAETNVQNVTKLNYHSYMNKQTRAKWSKSETDLFYQGLCQFGSDFAMIQQLFPDKTHRHVRQKFKSEEGKNPMLIHDAIIHRSGDNLYFKKVIKQLNIEDEEADISSANKQDGASNEGDSAKALDNFYHEEDRSNQLDKEQDMHMSDVQEEEHAPGNSDDELGAIFDWY